MPTVDRVLPWRRSERPRRTRSRRCWRRSAPPPEGPHRPDRPRLPDFGRGPPGPHRRSGEPYIKHPFAVAPIVADLGLDDVTVAAALLHDAVEDTGITLDDLEAEFGRDVTAIVDGVTKLERIKFDTKEAQQAATMRKMLVAMAKDLRVLIIKLSDRLHNMRTIAALPECKQERTASETLDIYAPLAHRLGMQEVRQSSRTSPSRPCTRSATPRSTTWSPPAAPSATSTSPRCSSRCATPRRAGDRGRGHRAPEAPLLHLREDGRQG